MRMSEDDRIQSPNVLPQDLDAKLARLLDPREGMRTREIFGGTGPETVARALAEAERRLSRMAP